MLIKILALIVVLIVLKFVVKSIAVVLWAISVYLIVGIAINTSLLSEMNGFIHVLLSALSGIILHHLIGKNDSSKSLIRSVLALITSIFMIAFMLK